MRMAEEELRRSRRPAFTVVELLVVIGIITLLMGLIIPAVQKVREAANRAVCSSHLRQLALGVHQYHLAHRRLPPGQVGPYRRIPGQPYYGWGPDSVGWSWLARLLPYVGQENAYRQGRIPRATLRQSGVAGLRIEMFMCPSDESYYAGPRTDAGNLAGFPVGLTCYKGVSGANWGDDKGEGKRIPTDWRHRGTNGSYDGLIEGDGLMWRSDISRRMRLQDIDDGQSYTFMIGEDIPTKNQWCSWPYANNAYGTCAIPPNVRKPDGTEYPPWNWHNTWSFRSWHPGGLQFAMADGSVHFIRSDIDLGLYRALATIRGNEIIDFRLLE